MSRRQTAKAILAEDRDFGCYHVHSRYNISKNKFTHEEVLMMAKNLLEKSGYSVLGKEGSSQ